MRAPRVRPFFSLALLLAVTGAARADDERGARDGWINVREAGARCNGVSDDTSAFQRAIARAPRGGVIFVPPGACVVSDTIAIDAARPVSIFGGGVGSQIFQKADKTLFRLEGVNALTIRDLFLGSAATSPGTALIELASSHHNRIDNVTMLGGYYGLHLNGALLNTMVDLRSGVNFQTSFFTNAFSPNQYWVFAERRESALISANANTFIAPALEGGVNGLWLVDTHGEGSLHIEGGAIEGVSGIALKLDHTKLPSTISGVHFEANRQADIVLDNVFNVRVSGVVSDREISILHDSRNISVSDSMTQKISIDVGDGGYTAGPGSGTGAKRILLENITACFVNGALEISPPPTPTTNGQGDGIASPVIFNPSSGTPRRDIIYRNIGGLCAGG